MKCPHCSKEIHFESKDNWVFQFNEADDEGNTGYQISYGFCPACNKLIVTLEDGEFAFNEGGPFLLKECNQEFLFPKGYFRPVSIQVPEKYADDYDEASAVLKLSPKASAAISRRLLQNLLRDECQVRISSLANEIDEFLKKDGVPSYLSSAIDAIRNVGNFAAHPLKNTNTGEIMDVEDGEAEWLLDVLDAMFDYMFVQPSILDERKKALNDKLRAIGKPYMKG